MPRSIMIPPVTGANSVPIGPSRGLTATGRHPLPDAPRRRLAEEPRPPQTGSSRCPNLGDGTHRPVSQAACSTSSEATDETLPAGVSSAVRSDAPSPESKEPGSPESSPLIPSSTALQTWQAPPNCPPASPTDGLGFLLAAAAHIAGWVPLPNGASIILADIHGRPAPVDVTLLLGHRMSGRVPASLVRAAIPMGYMIWINHAALQPDVAHEWLQRIFGMSLPRNESVTYL